jgi:hypothetical protein
MKKTIVPAVLFLMAAAFSQCKSDEKKATASRAEQDSAYAKLSNEDKRLAKHAVAGLEIAGGLEAQLFASEPMVGNPPILISIHVAGCGFAKR